MTTYKELKTKTEEIREHITQLFYKICEHHSLKMDRSRTLGLDYSDVEHLANTLIDTRMVLTYTTEHINKRTLDWLVSIYGPGLVFEAAVLADLNTDGEGMPLHLDIDPDAEKEES